MNKGAGLAGKVTAKLELIRPSAEILQAKSGFGNIAGGEMKISGVPFTFRVKDTDIEIERFRLIIKDQNGLEWKDFIDVPLKTDGTEIKDFIVADGREFAVAAAGDDTVSVFLGNGNGDGKANPGESIVILVNDNGRYFRTYLYTAD